MNIPIKYLVSLEEAIQQWADKHCEEDDLNVWWSEDTVHHMANASYNVLCAVAESQQFCRDNNITD